MVKCLALLLGALFTLACSLASTRTSQPDVQPTPAALAGWKQFTAGGAELWLPDSFEGGDPSQDLELMVERLRARGPEFERMANIIERNPHAFVFMAIDTTASDSGFLTNVNVVKEKVLSLVTIDTYGDMLAKNLTASFRIIDRKRVALEHYEAVRVVIQVDAPDIQAQELVYILKQDNSMWCIAYTAGQSDFDQALPIFEQSAHTFVVQP